MPTTDTSEKGLETIIVNSLLGEAGYIQGLSTDYDREYAVDLIKLTEFVQTTQPKAFESLSLEEDSPRRTKFLHRLQGEIAKRGVIDVLRTGILDGPVHLDLFYLSPSDFNPAAKDVSADFTLNIEAKKFNLIFGDESKIETSGNKYKLNIDGQSYSIYKLEK